MKICTKCGYEGRGKSLPGRNGTGLKILGVLLMLPLHSMSRIFGGGGGKICPLCETPTMVKLRSDAGRLAQQRMDIELGILKPIAVEKKETDTFGADKPAERITKAVDPDQW